MLSSLDFLQKGKQFPPDDPDTQERFGMYQRNKELFYGNGVKQGGLFDKDLKRLGRVIGNFDDVIDFTTLLNYHKLISVKTADLIFGEKPLISVEDEKDTIENIEENTQMFNKFYQNVIDCSRYGNGVFDLYEDEKFGNFDVIQPSLWIPIVDPNNFKKIINHVIAFNYEVNNKKYLSVKVHYKGYFDKFIYEMGDGTNNKIMTNLNGQMIQTQNSSNTIGRLIATERVQTGLIDFAIQVTSNLITSDKITGCNDYDDINSLICALMIRVGQIEKILDKHSDPSVSAPSSAFIKDPETGEYTVKMGNAFIRDSVDDVEPKYITWEAQLEANFTQIAVLLNQLYVLSEMGATLLGGEDKGNSNMSGRALKFKMISPLAKAKRITMLLDPVIKNVIKLVSSLGGEGINDLTDKKITIKWQDGLPNDEFEEAEIIEKRRNSNTMSTKRALMQYDQMDEENADEEIERIQEEEESMNPLSEKPFSGNNVVEDDDDE